MSHANIRYAPGIILIVIVALVVSFVSAGPSWAGNGSEERIKKAIVKVFTVSSRPDYYSPWDMGAPRSASGSGFVIAGGRILTNAHVVSDATFIQVQPYGSSRRYNARVLHISHESDLAILGMEDDGFFDDIRPLKFGGLPEVLEEVLAYGFPLGGDSLSITKGIISRIEYQDYAHSGYYFLAGQIDAAINPGNSGGPVIQDGEVVGIVMQAFNSSQAENIGYMIPTPMIYHFLDDLSDGSYDGFPDVGFSVQEMESPALKRKYGMGKDLTGVLVNKVFWNSPAQGNVREEDVLLKIDGHTIEDDGSVEFRPNERVVFDYYADLHQLGQEINLTVLRGEKELEVSYAMTQRGEDMFLVPPMRYDVRPEYFIFAGIVFSPLTKNLICEWKNCKAPKELLVEGSKRPDEDRREVVLVVQVLPADVNKGYHALRSWIVGKVGGRKIKDFREFHSLITNSTEDFIVLTNEKGYRVVLDREEAIATHEDVLRTYNITEDGSPGFRRQ
ncbi:hypothetical protein LCGC14_1725040 [marine sediment metagenome]|uniref:PDZ domain-containing protein n=1 Tax=marine sediment metagenome TaxID=412755 RepID=A0A0F9HZ49_9ZZZZ